MSLESIIVDHINNEQPMIIQASKSLLSSQYFTLKNDTLGVYIEHSEQSAHKQLFPLLLKQRWEYEDLQKLMGFLAIMHLINVASQQIDYEKIAPVLLLSQTVWEAIQADSRSLKECKKYHIGQVEKIPLLGNTEKYAKTLQQTTVVKENITRFILGDICFHVRLKEIN
jgi:hypothetical protein